MESSRTGMKRSQPDQPDTSQATGLLSRCTPRHEWNADLASQWLQQRFGRPWKRADLLQALIVIQHHFGSVTPVAQQWLAHHCQTDRAEIRALIHFYHFLEEDDPLPLRIRFASNIIEQHQGLQALLEQLQHSVHQHARVSKTACIGLSDQGPAALVNGFPLTHLNARRIEAIAEKLQQQVPLQEWPAEWFRVEENVRVAGPLLSFHPDPGNFIPNIRARDPHAIINEIKTAGLRGRGGAGFPTGVKWEHCAATPAPQRYVVCNADEGEPGTFKDRVLLQRHADAVFCGMALCGHAIGARHGIVYLRGEYLFLFAPLQQRLQHWRTQQWLGDHFDIEIHLGAGAYVCGEETALLESVEGKRGIPRVKPPFPVQHGLFGMPTVVNNVETFAAAAWIAEQGADAFRQSGTPQSAGTHVHSVSGDCAKPGIYELPFGTPLDQLLTLCGATDCVLVQVGGPSGVMVDSSGFQQPLAHESMSPGGSIMVFDHSRAHLDIARNFTAFFKDESCGFCTPCRAGCQILQRDLQQPSHRIDTQALRQLAQLVNDTSHCGLGQTAGRPVLFWLDREHP
jgi:[NiFe] hydrogenase diaphorase moiety large subunit